MSDFVQTMKDWRRMCKAQDDTTCEACSSCPMGDYGKSCMAVYEDEFETVDFAHIEQTVTAWAAEHPEPKYQSWGEWLSEIGVFQCEDGEWRFAKANDPIPADIAQKLGIEPKEGV